MAVSALEIERTTAALKADVAATLGTGHESMVDYFVEHGRGPIEDAARFTQWLVDATRVIWVWISVPQWWISRGGKTCAVR